MMREPYAEYMYQRLRWRMQGMHDRMCSELIIAHRRVETMYTLLCESTLEFEHLYVARVINVMRRLQWIENFINTIERFQVLHADNESMLRIQDRIFTELEEMGVVSADWWGDDRLTQNLEYFSYNRLGQIQHAYSTN